MNDQASTETDIELDGLGRAGGSESRHDVPGAIDQELGEIPFDRGGPQQARPLRFQEREQRMSAIAVDVNLREQRKRDVVFVLAELVNLLLGARLLTAKLIARKPEHDETAIAIFPVERLQARVLRRESTLARDIDDEHHLSAKLMDAYRPLIPRHHVEVVNWSHRGTTDWHHLDS
jgi:hypothetical protein